MTQTIIHTTKKLEKHVKKLIQTDKVSAESGILGKWNATIFHVYRKKCWLLTNGLTKYNLILTDIRASELKEIDAIFKFYLYKQLIYDGIIIDFDRVDEIIGKLDFRPTDNDRSTTGFQNQRLLEFDWWKYDYTTLEDMPIKELTNLMNNIPIHISQGKKMSDYTNSFDEMKKVLLK